MPLQLHCPNCARPLSVEPQAAGANVVCPGCRNPFTVPVVQSAAAPGLPPQPSTPPRWFVSNDGVQRQGPYTDAQLAQFVRQGLVTLHSRIWREGWPDWRILGEVPELRALLPPASPPAPAPAPAPGRSSGSRAAAGRSTGSMRRVSSSAAARARARRSNGPILVAVAFVALLGGGGAVLFVLRSSPEDAAAGGPEPGRPGEERPAQTSPHAKLAERLREGSDGAAPSFDGLRRSAGLGASIEALVKDTLRSLEDRDVLCVAPEAERTWLDADLSALPRAKGPAGGSVDVRLAARVALDLEPAIRNFYVRQESPIDAARSSLELARRSVAAAGVSFEDFESALTRRTRTSTALREHFVYFLFRLATLHRTRAVLEDAGADQTTIVRVLGLPAPTRAKVEFALATEALAAARGPAGGGTPEDPDRQDPEPPDPDRVADPEPDPGPGEVPAVEEAEPVWADVEDAAVLGRPGSGGTLRLSPGKRFQETAALREAWRYDGISTRIVAGPDAFAGVFFDGNRIACVSGADGAFVVAHVEGSGRDARWIEDARVPCPGRRPHDLEIVIVDGLHVVTLDGAEVVRVPSRHPRLATTGLRVQGGEATFESLRLRRRN